MFFLGGSAGRANIEVHDVQFAVCNSYRDAIPALKAVWFGDAGKIHLDGWRIVNWADGCDVRVVPANHSQSASGSLKLYFANVGGYYPDTLAEAHDFGLFAAADAGEAGQKALAVLLSNCRKPHKDSLKSVNDILLPVPNSGGWQIELVPNPHGQPEPIGFQGYEPI